MRTAFRYLTSLLALAVVVQIGFAGYGAFNAIDKADNGASISKKTIENGFDPHGFLGSVVLLLMLLVLLAAAAGRLGPAWLKWTGLLFGLGIVEMLLAWGATGAAWVGFLHGINALAIAALAGMAAGRAWREGRVASAM